MKSFSPGLSDSIASVLADPAQCPHCDSSSHIAGGLCVGCLLQAGLDSDDECEPEALASAFAEISLPDKNWRLGNYEILEEIGRGGMGVIYRARQRHSRRIVAVKRVLSYHSDSRETLARFRREAQAAASLDHPNILPIYEVSESEDGLPFFSMKFAPGGNLQEVGPALRNDPRQCVALVAKVARAVQYAHAKGILHRDLKPGNILLDGRGEPLVSDFGLAKWLDTTSDLTRTLTIFGTPGYIAPEQASGSAAQLKPAADVYSLGAILFDLLAGRPPFLGTHALSVIRQASENPAPKLRTLSRIADRDLETICAHCLERDPGARYRSAHDLAEDLEHWLEGRPIIARPISPATRLYRWARRNSVTATIGSVVFLLAGVLAISQAQHFRLSHLVRSNTADQHSIAVLPILDLDDATLKSQTEFASLLEREMSRHGAVRVIPQTPPEGAALVANANNASYVRLAKTAKARAILTVTQRRHGNKMRVAIRLFNGAGGDLIFRRIIELEGLSKPTQAIPNQFAKTFYALLDASDLSSAEISPIDPGYRNDSSRELILAGTALLDRRTMTDIAAAMECFRKAINFEPTSAMAHSLLALTQAGYFVFDGEPTTLSAAESSAKLALSFNPNLGEAHRALATVYELRGNFKDACEEVFVAYELGDAHQRITNLAARIQRRLGRPDKALTWYRIAAPGQARPGQNDFVIGDCWTDLGVDEEATKAYTRAGVLFPYLPESWMGLCRLSLLRRDFGDATRRAIKNWQHYPDFVFSKAMAAQVAFFSRNFEEAESFYKDLATKDPNGGGSFYGCVSYNSAIGRLRIAAGDTAAGAAILDAALAKEKTHLQFTPHHAEILYRIAAIESSLSKIESGISHLDAAVQAGWIDYRSLAIDPRFDALRETAGYERIFHTMVTRVTSLRESIATRESGLTDE